MTRNVRFVVDIKRYGEEDWCVDTVFSTREWAEGYAARYRGVHPGAQTRIREVVR